MSVSEREDARTTQSAASSFSNVGRVPDFVRDLGKFEGRPTELISWISDVEGIFDLFSNLPKESTEYGLIERTIRRKVIGEASDVLNANNVLHDWSDIKQTLLLYYRDKRDLKTLDYELTTVSKTNNESLSSYFSRVNELLASIIVQVQTDPALSLSATSHINYFRDKALDSFARGLEKPLNILLKTANVSTLSSAYQFCLEYYNMDVRSSPFKNQHSNIPVPRPRELDLQRKPHLGLPPPVPLRRNLNPFRPPVLPPVPPPRNFAPFHHSNPFRQKPFPKPEPMEIDESIRSRTLNYGNRPIIQSRPFFSQKRPHPPGSGMLNPKRQAHPLEQDDYNGYRYTDSPEYYPDNYDYLDEDSNYYRQQDQFQYEPWKQPEHQFLDTQEQQYEQQITAHNPAAEYVTQSNAQIAPSGNEMLTPPDDAVGASNSGQAIFLEWGARWQNQRYLT